MGGVIVTQAPVECSADDGSNHGEDEAGGVVGWRSPVAERVADEELLVLSETPATNRGVFFVEKRCRIWILYGQEKQMAG